MGKLIYEELTFQIRKSLFNVYNQLGPGYREETYKQAVIRDFNLEGIPYYREKIFPVHYRDEQVDEYRVDLIAFDKIIMELKAVAELHPRFEAQLLSYLKLTNLKLGLLINFGSDKLEIRRFVNPHGTS
ncbi:MAG: GxxExxY protein [candidate division KSB1 bacterium]